MRRQEWILAWVMGTFHIAFHFFMRIVPPLIPILALELEMPLWMLGLLVSLFFAGSTVGLLPAGILADTYDRRGILTAGLLLVCLSYLGFGSVAKLGAFQWMVSTGGVTINGTFLVMSIAMLLAGLGTSVHIPSGVPIIVENAREENKGKVLGIWGGTSKIGDAATPAVIGVLIVAFGWGDIVIAFAIIGVMLSIILFVVLGLEQFRTLPPVASGESARGNGDNEFWQTDRRAYLFPMVILVLYFAGYQIVVQGVVTFTPTFVTQVYDYSFTMAGVYFAPESFADFALSTLLIAGALSRFGAGWLVDLFDYRIVMVVFLAFAAVTLAILSFASLGPVALLVILAIFGGTLWGNTPARDALISDISPSGREGRTFSYLWTASRGFGALAPVLLGYVADTAGIRQGFSYLVGGVLIAVLAISLLFSERLYSKVGD